MRAAIRFAVAAAAAACTLAPRDARAQPVHSDVGVEGGVMRRVLTGRPTGGPDAGFGWNLEAHGHVAVLPMLRAGLYFATDVSPVSGYPARHVYSGGLRAKITPPWLRTTTMSTWVFTGFGYAAAYGPSFHAQLAGQNDPARTLDAAIAGAWGHYFEVPLGVGAAWALRKPWQLFAELGGRIGFAHGGDLYDGPSGTAPGLAQITVDPRGNDTLALFLNVGVGFDL